MRVSRTQAVFVALQQFASDVKQATELGARIPAQEEDQLKQSVPKLVKAIGDALGRNVSILSESPVNDIGRPDLAIAVDGALVGYIELKAPGHGTTDRDFNGSERARNRQQFKKFLKLPNLLYTDARDWTLYVNGDRVTAHDIRLGAIDEISQRDITETDASDFLELFREFLKWEPIVPSNPKALAELLAPLTRLLRDGVEEALGGAKPALSAIYEDWKRTLFPDATAAQFADSYAQTVTYGLLLAKLSGAVTLNTKDAAKAIAHHSSLLARTLEILTQEGTRDELGPGLQLLERTIDAVNPDAIQTKAGGDPWLYFYEDFLAVYDPRLRNERGVYYTPVQVVKAQVTLVDELLRTKLNKPDGVADRDVTVLDPATGTGTYLLQVLQTGISHAMERFGPGAVGNIASQMAQNLYGFELLVGPYAVAHLRLTQAIHEAGGHEPKDGAHVYLTDTLESPNDLKQLPHSFFEAPLAEEHRRARQVKQEVRILVCIGNPPYEREESDSGEVHTAGGWVRFGDQVTNPALLDRFLAPARAANAGIHIKNLYNLYVYFWRWALWKVFDTQDGPGIVSFITASSYLRGPGFVGMREEMRRTFDEMWILDLEGDSRGTRRTENVFDIQTPVAIAIGVRYGAPDRDQAAILHYTKLTGSRTQKFEALETMRSFADVHWQEVAAKWRASFLPIGEGDYFEFPKLTQLLPWSQSGVKVGRTWILGEHRHLLEQRLSRLTQAPQSDRRAFFKDSPTGRKTLDRVTTKLGSEPNLKPIVSTDSPRDFASPVRYSFRSFDRQWVVPDYRLIDRPGPPLWRSVSHQQIFLTSLFEHSLGNGPAVIATALIPDLHHFRGSYGGKDVVPLYRDAEAKHPNITHGLLDRLGNTYGVHVTPEDLIAYIAGVVGYHGYTERFHDELDVPGPRVPVTKDPGLFCRAVDLGKQVIAWQTYAERFPDEIGTTQGRVPSGSARLSKPIPDGLNNYPHSLRDVEYDEEKRELRLGEGVIGYVDPQVWEYEVSGLQVVRSWLGYRVTERSGRRSSPLDDIRPERWTWQMTQELLELIWVLEGVVALEPAQDALLSEIVAGELFLEEELPVPTEAEQRAPTIDRQPRLIG